MRDRVSRRARRGAAAILAVLTFLPSAATAAHRAAPVPVPKLCLSAIAQSERAMHLPPLLLGAIGQVESGRPDPATGRILPWPWTVNVEGQGYFFPTRQAAIEFVRFAQSIGEQSIDIGCMQINLFYHPQAFASLEEGFSPQANTRYAALFLTRLYGQTGDWSAATAAYHSMTPAIGAEYAARVTAYLPPDASRAVMLRHAAEAALAERVDPYGVLTPEFRARLVQQAADRAARDQAMGLPPGPGALPPEPEATEPARPATRIVKRSVRGPHWPAGTVLSETGLAQSLQTTHGGG